MPARRRSVPSRDDLTDSSCPSRESCDSLQQSGPERLPKVSVEITPRMHAAPVPRLTGIEGSAKCLIKKRLGGEPCWTRTSDPLLKSRIGKSLQVK